MDYFLDIYKINNWNDFNIFLTNSLDIDNNIKILIFSALLKSKTNNIIITPLLINFIRPIFIKLNICDNKTNTNDILIYLHKLIDKYKNNKNEPLLFDNYINN